MEAELSLSTEEIDNLLKSGVDVIISPKGNLVLKRNNKYQLAYCYRRDIPCTDLCALFREPIQTEDALASIEICHHYITTSVGKFKDMRG